MALPRLYAVPGVRYLKRDTEEATPKTRYYADCRDPKDTTKDPRGKRLRPFLGRNLKVAQMKLVALLAEVGVEAIESDPEPEQAASYTLADAQAKCMADLVAGNLQESTRKRYVSSDRNALKRFTTGKDGKPIHIHQITRSEVKAWFHDRARETSPTTANRDLGRLAQVLDWAIDHGWLLTANPARKIGHFAEPVKSEPFTDEEWSRLFAAAKRNSELLDAIIWAGETGMRWGEQFTFRRSVNLRPGQVWLKAREGRRKTPSPTKTKKGRPIPITPLMLGVLQRQELRHPGADLLFPNTAGSQWSRGNFRLWRWKPLFEEAGLYGEDRSERATWHSFRHDFCSRLRQGGADLIDIAELAGHDNLSVTRRYAGHFTGHLETKMANMVRPPLDLETPSCDTQSEEAK